MKKAKNGNTKIIIICMAKFTKVSEGIPSLSQDKTSSNTSQMLLHAKSIITGRHEGNSSLLIKVISNSCILE